jgi:hypothetical protein
MYVSEDPNKFYDCLILTKYFAYQFFTSNDFIYAGNLGNLNDIYHPPNYHFIR